MRDVGTKLRRPRFLAMSAHDLQSFIYEQIRAGKITLTQAFAVLAEFDAVCTDMTRLEDRPAIRARIAALI
jgi:hypothetical protein